MFNYEIVRIRLKNFSHFTTIGLDDFTIDRYGSKNNIITIIGANGSGKSLLCTAWSPRVNDSTANRKRPIVAEGKEGLKELDILTTNEDGEHGEYLYKCRIVYGDPSTNCSLIKVDRLTGEMVELNPSGLVTSYENIISEVFGMSKNYKTIGYLSPQITSIVAMSPADRYNYLSTWLPDIGVYLESYKLIFKRMNTITRQIKMLEGDIGGISIENVTRDRNILSVKLETISKNMENLKNIRMNLSMVRDNLVNISKDSISKLISTINKNKNILDNSYNKLVKMSSTSLQYCGVDGKEKLLSDINVCESRVAVINSQLNNVSRSLDEKRLRLKEIEYNLGMLEDTGDSLPEISLLVERLEESLLESKNIMIKYKDNYTLLTELSDSFTINEFNIINNLVSFIRDKQVMITDVISLDKIDNISDHSSIADRTVKGLLEKSRNIESKISKVLERISLLKNSPLDSSILNMIPSFCVDFDDCGVIKEIKRLLSPDNEVDKLTDDLQKLYSNKDDILSEIDCVNTDSNNMVFVISYINDINHYIMRDNKYIAMLPKELSNIFTKSISSIFSDMNILSRGIETIREFISIRDQSNLYITELKNLKDKESSLRFVRSMNSDISNITNSIDSMISERNMLHNEGEMILDKYKILIELKDSISDINDNINEYNSQVKTHIDYSNKMKKICKDWYYRELIQKSINKLNIDIDNCNIDHNNTISALESVNNSLITKKSLIDMRDRLLQNSKELEFLEEAWNPKTGIPSLFINNFLTRIHVKTNEYLKLLNGDSLKILKFEIGKTSREFPIIMEKDGDIIPDAFQLSEGQIALLSLALSLAMMKEAVGENGYSILRLDELDGCLDHQRRIMYIEMIKDRLIEINSRQCLIISHNTEFDSVETDVIMLPGAKFNTEMLANKNVIFDASSLEIN